MRDNLSTNLHRQKEIYDNKSHGCPYHKRDLVWLFNPVVPSGKSKKFHKPWTRPYTVVKQLSDSTYRIQHTQHRSKWYIVHFDCLKSCNIPRVNSPQHKDTCEQATQLCNSTELPALTLRIVCDGDIDDADINSQPMASTEPRRYPSRTHHPPAHLADFVHH